MTKTITSAQLKELNSIVVSIENTIKNLKNLSLAPIPILDSTKDRIGHIVAKDGLGVIVEFD